jgi:hypothetical protein
MAPPTRKRERTVVWLTVALKGYGTQTPVTYPAPERIHAEGELGDWNAAARMPPEATGSPTGEGKAQEPAPEPIPRPWMAFGSPRIERWWEKGVRAWMRGHR